MAPNNNSSNRILRVLGIAILIVSLSNFVAYDMHNHNHQKAATSIQDSFSNRGSISDQKLLNSSTIISRSNRVEYTPTAAANLKLEFCGHCNYSPSNSCNERLKYLMQKYNTPEDEAKESLLYSNNPNQKGCGIDYNTEPYVLLHAGPHKTGTTSIQNFLYNSLSKNAAYLYDDMFAVPTFKDLPGAFGVDGVMLNFAHCMLSNFAKDGGQMNVSSTELSSLFLVNLDIHKLHSSLPLQVGMCNKLRGPKSPFPRFLERNFNKSHHVLLVAEDLDRLTIDHGRIQYYLRPYRRFKVVVTYRRMHDWLPSWYNQIVELYLAKYIAGEHQYPNFIEWIEKEYNHFRQVHAMEVAQRYRNSGKFESVEIINMHEDVSLLQNLFCNYLPFANSTCQSIKNGEQPKKRNVGKTYEYERLATKAQLRGKIQNKDAPKVAQQLKQAVVKQGIWSDENAYPKLCLNDTFLDQLLRLEMQQERLYFPQWYDLQGGDEGLRKAFEKAKPKLCSMDDEQVLASGILDSIFDKLNNR